MSEFIYGSILYKEHSYPFFLDDRKVNIVGEAFQYYDDFKDAECEETISGITSDNRYIMFLHCKFKSAFFMQTHCFYPVGYILSSDNMGAPYDFTFQKISFYSDAINSFYPPQIAIDKTDWQFDNDGRITIKLKPFETTDISFVYNECKCTISINRHVNMQANKSDIGNINSVFSFEFNTVMNNKELPQYWLALLDFLSFINYGTDIVFDKIKLSKKCENGLFEPCANAYIFSDRNKYTPRSTYNAITIQDIPFDKLGVMFSKITSIRGNDKRLGYYFPKNYTEGLWIDPHRWLIAAMNFDGLFANRYPDFKQNENEQFRKAKLKALSALKKVNEESMSKKECNYFKDCYNQLERYEGLLEEKFNFIVNKYKCALDDILKSNTQKYNVNYNDYGVAYRSYRNKLAHGEIEPVGKNEVAVYKVLQALIYFMLLEGVDFNDDTLRTITKKLFL